MYKKKWWYVGMQKPNLYYPILLSMITTTDKIPSKKNRLYPSILSSLTILGKKLLSLNL